MAFIDVLGYERAEGELKDIYDSLLKSRGKLAEVHKIQSLHPRSITAHMDLYMEIMFGKSPLKRYQREMIAVVVSVANKCKYCTQHHGEALNHYWKSNGRLNKLIDLDYDAAELSEDEKALCEYARKLTIDPKSEEQQISRLKKLGWNERAILDTTLIIAYFNFVNRIVLGLGVELEDDGGEGYKY